MRLLFATFVGTLLGAILVATLSIAYDTSSTVDVVEGGAGHHLSFHTVEALTIAGGLGVGLFVLVFGGLGVSVTAAIRSSRATEP